MSTVVTVGMTAVLQVERFNLIGQFEGQDCEFRGSSCTDVGKFCMVSALAREVDRSKHHSVYRGERDRVDAYAHPRWWCCSPHQLTVTLPLSTTSSLELLINYKTSVFWSSSHDLPTRDSVSSYVPGLPHKRGLITSSIKYG